jgi:hypothetical protein
MSSYDIVGLSIGTLFASAFFFGWGRCCRISTTMRWAKRIAPWVKSEWEASYAADARELGVCYDGLSFRWNNIHKARTMRAGIVTNAVCAGVGVAVFLHLFRQPWLIMGAAALVSFATAFLCENGVMVVSVSFRSAENR